MVSGAGAAAMSCLDIYEQLGMKRENAAVFDSRGHIHAGREGLDASKQKYATSKAYADLADAMKGADVFLGLSKGGPRAFDTLVPKVLHLRMQEV